MRENKNIIKKIIINFKIIITAVNLQNAQHDIINN